MFKRSCLTLIILLLCFKSYPQIKIQGTHFIKNFSSTDYHLHPKNFAIVQDNRGVMYFGNAYGILEYDGNNWRTINLPNGKSAISLTKDNNGKIFVGSVSELGYLNSNSKGRVYYESLLNQIPVKDRNFREVLSTYSFNRETIFCSFSQISIFTSGQVKILKPGKSNMVFDFAGNVNGKFLVRESGEGLKQLENTRLRSVKGGEYFATNNIFSIFPYSNDQSIILSQLGLLKFGKNTVEKVNCAVTEFLKNNLITKAIKISQNFYALGTQNNGILIFDFQGNIKQHYNKENGLASNYIYDIYSDNEENLWVATDNGLSYIQTSSPFTSIGKNENIEGMGYAAFINQGKIYLGTSEGLFVKKWGGQHIPSENKLRFVKVKNLEEQIWALHKAGNSVLCGTNRGVFEIKEDFGVKISSGDFTGGWVFRPFKGDSLVIAGTYDGLEIYRNSPSGWKFRNKIKGFNESSRTIEVDHDGIIWVCHGNNGLFKIKLNEKLDSAEEVKNISKIEGYRLDYFNDICWIDNELVFAGHNYLYKINRKLNRLERLHELNKIIGSDVLISKIFQQRNGDIWLVNNDIIEVLEKNNAGKFTKNEKLFRKLKGHLIGSFEFFWKYNDENFFIGTQNGFVHFDPSVKLKNKPFNVIVRKVELLNNKHEPIFMGTYLNSSGKFSLAQPPNAIIEVAYADNALRFSYSSLFFEDHEKNQYQYYLEKNGNLKNVKWSAWTSEAYKDYTNLSEGTYTFHVRAKNIFDTVTPQAAYRFVILPPWYRTSLAYIIYFLISIVLICLIVKLLIAKIEKEKARIEIEKRKEMLLLEKQFQAEALKAEREIILLQKEKLESEVKYKNEELSTLATNLSQKTEFLGNLRKSLITISKELKPEQKVSTLNELIKSIDKGAEFDDTWEHFQNNFDTVHQNFLFKIRERFPFLKPTDLLLCSYIRMSKSNKEISSLLNISVSAVEKRRFRLREKIKLTDDTKLTEFLMGL